MDDKSRLLEDLLQREGLRGRETVMIGDREHDILAAKNNRLFSIGVTYGYGSRAELSNAAPDFICDSPGELPRLLHKFEP